MQKVAADFIQASRILKINSPLSEDQLLPERVTIEESIFSLFEIRFVACTKKAQIKPEELIGWLLDVSIKVQMPMMKKTASEAVLAALQGAVSDAVGEVD